MKVNPLDYWKLEELIYPFLSKVAASVLSIPASAAAAERLFSIAGKLYRPEKCRLNDVKFEQLLNQTLTFNLNFKIKLNTIKIKSDTA